MRGSWCERTLGREACYTNCENNLISKVRNYDARKEYREGYQGVYC